MKYCITSKWSLSIYNLNISIKFILKKKETFHVSVICSTRKKCSTHNWIWEWLWENYPWKNLQRPEINYFLFIFLNFFPSKQNQLQIFYLLSKQRKVFSPKVKTDKEWKGEKSFRLLGTKHWRLVQQKIVLKNILEIHSHADFF